MERSYSSRRRKDAAQTSSSPSRRSTGSRRKQSVAYDSGLTEQDVERARKSSIPLEEGSRSSRKGNPFTGGNSPESRDERKAPTFSVYEHSADSPSSSSVTPSDYNLYTRSPRGSFDIRSQRTEAHGLDPLTRKSRASLIPEIPRSSRSSQVPDESYTRAPRGSIQDPTLLSRGSKSNLYPESDGRSRDTRNSRNSLAPEISPSRSPRGSLVPEGNISPRGSLVPDCNRSPRGSLVPDIHRSPRGSLIPDGNRSARGSLTADISKTPRGSVVSEGAVYTMNRNSRNSLTHQETMSLGKSSRGSNASSSGVQFDLSVKTSRGSIDSVPGGIIKSETSRRTESPIRSSGSKGASQNATADDISRRASSSVSQVGVSADDRRQLCEHTKLNSDAVGGLTAYGSFVYQLDHANMESSGTCDFVMRALRIIYRTVVVTVALVCLTALPLVMLIMGLEFLRDCPKQPHIPMYMIVGGCFGLMELLWILWRQVRSLRYERLSNPRNVNDDFLPTSVGTRIAYYGLSAFLVIWFFIGNYWIYSIYWPEAEPTLFDPDKWCHRILYTFSIIHIYIIYSVFIIIIIITIVIAIFQIFVLKYR